MSSLPNIPNLDATGAQTFASSLRDQAKAIRADPGAGYETIKYKVRRGGFAGFFGAHKTVTETRLKPGAKQLLDNASMLEQQATYYDALSKTLADQQTRQDALTKAATADEQKALQIQKPVNQGGSQFTRNDLTVKPGLAIALGAGMDENQGYTGGLRIPYGT